MQRILIVGGGYAGFYAARTLERRLSPTEAELTIIDPRPYMTYQPFLPEVAAGSIEPRHAAVSHRRHLKRTRLIAGRVTVVDHQHKIATVQPSDGGPLTIGYDIILVTAGAVTRTFPIPGLREQAIGFKHVEEAVAVRDRLMTALDRAAVLEPGPERRRLLTVTIVGGGFTGIEVLGELMSLARSMIRRYPELRAQDLNFHLIEARDRVLPEVTDRPGRWVVRSLQDRGARIHLNTTLESAQDGHLVLSDGEEFDTDLLIWAAGNAATEVVARHTDLPTDPSGLLIARPELRIGGDNGPVADAWTAGDDAFVPDLASPVRGARTVPNAQHAVRQGKRVGKNIAAYLHGRRLKPYVHHSIGVVATLGIGRGIFQYHRLVIKGPLAWLIHRGYHVLAVPMWERKARVAAGWMTQAIFGRDLVSLEPVQHPRREFVDAAELDRVRSKAA